LGKIVGLAYHDNQLYVASNRGGKIAIVDAQMKPIRTVTCDKCSIFDIDVLTNGNIVVVQGARKVVSILDGRARVRKVRN
jgi:hypothetical protein